MNPDTFEPELITSDMIVADVLKRWPQTVPVFLKHRMSCVGCDMSIFEYISDAISTYGLEIERFMTELNQAATSKDQSDTSAEMENMLE